jgi:Homing endonuclease
MKTITLEIEKDNDFQKIVELAQSLGLKIVSTKQNPKDENIDDIKQFYNQFQFEVKDFKFDREEANER